MPNKNFIDKLAYIDTKDQQVLMTRSKGKDTWYIPGGKREKGETDSQALIREMREETTIELIPESIHHYGTFEAQAHGKPKGTIVRMTCYTADFTGTLQPNAEIEEVGYHGYELYPTLGPVDQLIFDDLKSKGLIE